MLPRRKRSAGDRQTKRQSAGRSRHSCFFLLPSYFPTDLVRSVLNPHAEAAAVVAVVVIVDGENQPAVGAGSERQLTADQKGLVGLTVGQANVAAERTRTRGRHGLSVDNGAEARAAPAFRSH